MVVMGVRMPVRRLVLHALSLNLLPKVGNTKVQYGKCVPKLSTGSLRSCRKQKRFRGAARKQVPESKESSGRTVLAGSPGQKSALNYVSKCPYYVTG